MRSVRRLLAAFALAALVAAPASAVNSQRVDEFDNEYAPPMMDVLVLRPVGLVGLALSSVLWVPAQLLTLAVNPSQWYMPMDHLLVKPARFVFVDPIGSH